MTIDVRPDDPAIDWDSPLNLNMANGNARKVLGILGLSGMEGEIDPADLMSRILLARIADDTGEPDAVDGNRYPGDRGATVVYCGLRPGYYAEKLDILYSIATYAQANEVKVVWY